jgi:hypothetical protein
MAEVWHKERGGQVGIQEYENPARAGAGGIRYEFVSG